jgi:hypothetical protein
MQICRTKLRRNEIFIDGINDKGNSPPAKASYISELLSDEMELALNKIELKPIFQ